MPCTCWWSSCASPMITRIPVPTPCRFYLARSPPIVFEKGSRLSLENWKFLNVGLSCFGTDRSLFLLPDLTLDGVSTFLMAERLRACCDRDLMRLFLFSGVLLRDPFSESRGEHSVNSGSKYSAFSDSIVPEGVSLRGGLICFLAKAIQSMPLQNYVRFTSSKAPLAPNRFSGSFARRPRRSLTASGLRYLGNYISL